MSSLVRQVSRAVQESPLTHTIERIQTKEIGISESRSYGIVDGSADIYHKNHFADRWLFLTILFHFVQFGILLGVGYPAISSVTLIVLLAIVIAVPVLLIIARFRVQKAPKLNDWKYTGSRTVDDESDYIPDNVIYILAIAAILEGGAFAIYPTASIAGAAAHLNVSGLYSFDTLVQTLRFASLTLYGFHRILRPANRLDPLRTMLELEVVSVCWDAIDGSTLYQLLGEVPLPQALETATRVLMTFWYVSVGARLSMMFCAHLSSSSIIYQYLLTQPLQLSKNPTVDRSLQSLRLRSLVTVVMATAEFFAGALRITLWTKGLLDITQQEMMLKNFLFLISVASAYSTFSTTETRAWNQRAIFMCIKKPSRVVQRQILRWLFALSYFMISAMLTSYIMKGNKEGSDNIWVLNTGVDIVLIGFFLIYCRNVDSQKRWIVFPGRLGSVLGVLLAMSLYAARLPGLYLIRQKGDGVGDDWSYENALFVVSLSVVPVTLYTLYWSISYMLFYPEYSACPGKYHATHDPIITVVSISYMTEGALDILSCSALMSIATNSLPFGVHGAVIFCVIIEMINACQCFALNALLAGVLDDTPTQLVLWKAKLRASRSVIDFIVFLLRVILWARYNAVSSVFLVKNIYNLFHGASLVERAAGIQCYPPRETMFMGFVSPQDWYNMTDEEWREATAPDKVAI